MQVLPRGMYFPNSVLCQPAMSDMVINEHEVYGCTWAGFNNIPDFGHSAWCVENAVTDSLHHARAWQREDIAYVRITAWALASRQCWVTSLSCPVSSPYKQVVSHKIATRVTNWVWVSDVIHHLWLCHSSILHSNVTIWPTSSVMAHRSQLPTASLCLWTPHCFHKHFVLASL